MDTSLLLRKRARHQAHQRGASPHVRAVGRRPSLGRGGTSHPPIHRRRLCSETARKPSHPLELRRRSWRPVRTRDPAWLSQSTRPVSPSGGTGFLPPSDSDTPPLAIPPSLWRSPTRQYRSSFGYRPLFTRHCRNFPDSELVSACSLPPRAAFPQSTSSPPATPAKGISHGPRRQFHLAE
jgi:hypothetical protein